jgi:hypothetical protein
MLTTLHLENFKGIASRQRVDFAPLTLLFGANSAGKSTILQALLYLHELIERGSADVDRTELGGNVLELGGFARLVHRHETNRAIVLRAEFATPGSLERFGRDLTHFPFPDLDDDIESAWLELTIRMRTTAIFRGALVEHAVIGVGGYSDPLVWLDAGESLREGEPLHARVHFGHPLFAQVDREVIARFEQIAVPFAIVLPPDTEPQFEDPDEDDGSEDIITPPAIQAFDGVDSLLAFSFAVSRSRTSALPSLDEPLRVIPFGEEDAEKTEIARDVRDLLEMIILGTTAQLATALRDTLYIGPLRTIPPRGFLYERAGRTTSWADGLAAWDLLLSDRTTLVQQTNLWLRRLGAGCQVVVQQLFDPTAAAEDMSAAHVDKTVRRLLLDTGTGSLVLPSEVGAGVSQLLPVIVAALEGRAGLALVEQPELHVHPAVQVGLGDLFIDAATRENGRRTMLVETHSEHLILRLLRRIRQTTEGELPEGTPPFTPEQLSVLYVESQPDGVRILRLRVDADGDFKDRWPKGFFAERREELL